MVLYASAPIDLVNVEPSEERILHDSHGPYVPKRLDVLLQHYWHAGQFLGRPRVAFCVHATCGFGSLVTSPYLTGLAIASPWASRKSIAAAEPLVTRVGPRFRPSTLTATLELSGDHEVPITAPRPRMARTLPVETLIRDLQRPNRTMRCILGIVQLRVLLRLGELEKVSGVDTGRRTRPHGVYETKLVGAIPVRGDAAPCAVTLVPRRSNSRHDKWELD
jgi:hypothetical protein